MEKIRAISLFSGAGGMDVGFERAGVEILVANEIMPEAAQTYKANHPDSIVMKDDINHVIPSMKEYAGIDLVFGGPPCQGFSVAGKMNPDDNRNKLIFTFLDAVEKIQPRAFVMENVKALATLSRWSAVRERYLSRAESIGYQCVPYLLDATDFGVSQKRERVFYVGIKNDACIHGLIGNLINRQKKKAPTIRALLQSLGRAGTDANPITCAAKITFAAHPVMRKSPYAGMYFNGQGRPIDIDGYANTLPASMGGNKTPFVDEEYLYGDAESDWVAEYHKGLLSGAILPEFREAPKRLRRITIKEAARIQSFPDDYIFCGNRGKVYMQIGNAVPCKLAEVVAKAVVQSFQ